MKSIAPYATILFLASLSIQAYSQEDSINERITTFLTQHDQYMKRMKHDMLGDFIAADAEIILTTKVAGREHTSNMNKAEYIAYLRETASDPERFVYQRSKIRINHKSEDAIVVNSKIKEVSYFDDNPLKLSIKQNMTLAVVEDRIIIKRIEEFRKH